MILEKFVVGPLANNTILLCSETSNMAAVVDPSFGSFEEISKYLKKNSFDLKKILLTHSHYDHIVDAKRFKEHFHAEIYIHKLDSDNLINPGSDGLLGISNLQGVMPDHFLEDGQKFLVGTIVLRVIHTPGHTPGSICFYIPSEKILLSGDTLFKGAFGRLDLPTSEPEKMMDSLKKLSKLPKDTKVISGHGSDTFIGKEEWLEDPKNFFI
ncbi:MAG: MBL fold metallo-hydrolase [Chlamydiae bacterium]|nr:MBL fold metallo-hydrolase [Chlamydiota bacterium]